MQFKSVQMKKGYSTFASILPCIIKSVDQCHTPSPSAGLHYSCLSKYQSSPHSWRSSHSTNPLSVCLAPTPLRGSKGQHVGWNMDTPRNLGCTGSLWLKSGHFNSIFQLPITMGEITYQGRSTDLSQKYPSPFDRQRKVPPPPGPHSWWASYIAPGQAASQASPSKKLSEASRKVGKTRRKSATVQIKTTMFQYVSAYVGLQFHQ